jgi:hypothetical protein
MDLAPIIARLKGEASVLRFVGGAADLPAATEELKQHPAAFVIPLTDSASRNGDATGSVTQQVTVRFGVLLAVQNLRDARGEAALTTLTPVRLAVRDALVGFVPEGYEDPCEIVGGRIMQLNDRVLWWQDDFLSMFIYRKVG